MADRPLLKAGETLSREEQKIRGSGDKYQPRPFEDAQRLLAPMASALRAKASELPDGLRGERVIFEAELMPNYLAASHFPTDLHQSADLVLVGTRAAEGVLRGRHEDVEGQLTKTLLLAATPRSFERLESILSAPVSRVDGKLQEDLVKFERFELAPLEHVVKGAAAPESSDEASDQDAWDAYEAVLHPAVDREGRLDRGVWDLVLDRWRALVARYRGGIHEDYVRSVGNLTFMPVDLPPSAVHEVARFNPLRAIRPMPRMRPIPTVSFREVDLDEEPEPPPDLPPANDRIAVFDGGVDSSHQLMGPFVAQTDLTSAPPDHECELHGTLVSSAALHGPIVGGEELTTPPAAVDHFRILPRPADVSETDEPYWVADRVKETIEAGGNWKVAVLSYGPEKPVDEDLEPDLFTATLDELAYVTGTTFVVAAGNNGGSGISPLGLDRVMAPADGVNVLGVGACTDPEPLPVSRADYSAVGPGRAGLRIQPMGVAFGGTAARRFAGAAPGGGFQESRGTSFAAPLAARGLATLMRPLGDDLDVNSARAFAAHFADRPGDDVIELGHGRFCEDYGDVLDCPPGEVTVLVQDTLRRKDTRGYPFPIPQGGLQGRVQLRWTVSFVSPVDQEDAVEYTLAGLDVDFRPNHNRYRLSPPRGSSARATDVDLADDAKKIAERARQGWKLSTNAKTRGRNAIRSELTQREDGKWETVVRFEDSLLSRTLSRPEVWLTYYERSQGVLLDRNQSRDLDVAMLLTVRAPRVPDLYSRIRQDTAFATLVPVDVAVPVRVPGN